MVWIVMLRINNRKSLIFKVLRLFKCKTKRRICITQIRRLFLTKSEYIFKPNKPYNLGHQDYTHLGSSLLLLQGFLPKSFVFYQNLF